jgi:UDP-2,3-diacylglucosamine pyrophosphatase LpxH
MKLTSKFIQKEIDKGNTLVLDKTYNTDKIVVFSDWHLGTGGNNDDSLKNCLYIFEALKYYYENNYLVILLGDTFELAEKNDIEDIKNIHEDIMWILTDIY